MKKEITPEIKAKIFALYLGAELHVSETPKEQWYPFDKHEGALELIGVLSNVAIVLRIAEQVSDRFDQTALHLQPLSSITDEDAIEVAKMAHQRFGSVWRIKRTNDLIHIESDGNVSDLYHISINPFCGSVNAHHHFLKTETNDRASYKVNVGSVNSSSKYVVGLYSIPDYLRSKGYALPAFGYSVDELVELGVFKLKEVNND